MSALDDISIKVRENEVFGLLGPNGSGKTTLIKILSTLILPSAGTARVAGFDVVSEDAKVRASATLVYMSQRSFYWRLTARQNLEFFGTLYNIPAEKLDGRIEEVLELVELSDRASEKITSYSTGMTYRLAIARGLLPDPPIIFIDEPTVGLDPHASRKIRSFIKEKLAGDKEKTVFIATNNIAEANFLCDRVAIIDKGKLKAVGSPEEVRGDAESLEAAFIKLTEEAG